MATNNPRAANALWQNRGVTTAELRSGFAKNDSDSADSEWNNQAKALPEPLLCNLAGQRYGIILMSKVSA